MDVFQEFLSPEEVQYLTGYTIKSKQKSQLLKMGIRFSENGAGRPIVKRNYDRIQRTITQPIEWVPSVMT